MKKTIFIVSLAAILSIPTLASAQMRGGPGMGMHPGWGPGAMAAALNLTSEQIQTLQNLRLNFFKETIPQRNQLQLARMERRVLWDQPNSDPGAVMANQKQINTLRDQIAETAVRYGLEARKVLTPQQWERAKSMMMTRGFGYGFGMRHHRMGSGYGMGCGCGMGCGWGMGCGYGMGQPGMAYPGTGQPGMIPKRGCDCD